MFWASSRPSSGAQQLQYQPLAFPLESGGSSAVGRGQTGHWLSHRSGNRQPKTYVKPEAAITVFELLMMSDVSPETC
jgi:hypothetical protein